MARLNIERDLLRSGWVSGECWKEGFVGRRTHTMLVLYTTRHQTYQMTIDATQYRYKNYTISSHS